MAKATVPDIRNRVTEYRLVRAGDILPNPKNWRAHPDNQRAAYRAITEDIGFAGALLTRQLENGTLMLVDGHMRTEENPDAMLPTLITDLTEGEAELILATYDPISAMAQADAAKLEELLQGVNSDDAAVQEMLTRLAEEAGIVAGEAEPPGDAGAAIDRAEELQKQYGVERGQVWVLGRHRIMCGSSYEPEHIIRLMDGKTPDMLHTDPPYGINIVKPRNGVGAADSGGSKSFGSTGEIHRKGKSAVAERDSGKVGGGRGDLLRLHARPLTTGRTGAPGNRAIPDRAVAERVHVQHGSPSRNQIIQSNLYPVIEGDDTPFEPVQFLDFAPIVIMWGANYYADKLPPKACWIVWDKREDITRNNFADCELAWTNQDKPARIFYHLWNGLHKGSQHGERRTHPTEKPVALFEEIGKLYADQGLWVDLFAGTGAQIVAAERSGATCYAMEYEPMYVATIIDRLAKMNIEPRLVEAVSAP